MKLKTRWFRHGRTSVYENANGNRINVFGDLVGINGVFFRLQCMDKLFRYCLDAMGNLRRALMLYVELSEKRNKGEALLKGAGMLLEEMTEYEKACTEACIPGWLEVLSDQQNKAVADLIFENPAKSTVEDVHNNICKECSLYCSSEHYAREVDPCWLSFEGVEVVGDNVRCKWEATA